MSVIKAVFEILESLLSGIITGIFDFLTGLMQKERKTEYDADFALPGDILSKRNTGFTFGDMSLDTTSSFRNALIYGMTGAGKNVSVLIPSILRMAESNNLIIHDPSQQLWELCSGTLSSLGIEIKILNYLNPALGGFNPLKGITANNTSAIQKIAKLLIHNTLGQSKEPFWNLSAESFLKILIQIVLSGPVETHSMFNVLELCNRFAHSPGDVDVLVVESKNCALFSEYKTFLKYDSKMMMSILATVRAALNLWSDPQVALCTAFDSMNMEEWRTKRFCLFIHSSVLMMRYYSPLTSLLFEQAFAHVMAKIPSNTDRNIFFLIDECSSLFLESINITYSNIRKYKGGVLSVFQSPFQLQNIYSATGAKAIEDNAYAKLYMPGVDIQVATQLEQMLGKFEYKDEKEVRHIRSLMVNSEIREADFSLLFTSNNRAVKLSLRPFYKQPKLLKMTKLPPVLPTASAPFDTPPAIQFSEAQS
jgi:type IV secretory pathway TraG/TraD family ATPase VirD4